MKTVKNQIFDAERALYNSKGLRLEHCSFDGPADGESALKESSDIQVDGCFFNLRYPFWHDTNLTVDNSELTELCRAALWYSQKIEINNTKLHGIKALRECRDVMLSDCDIISPEFGWSVTDAVINNCRAESEYFMLRSEKLKFNGLDFKGKYSFQYVRYAELDNCILDTKDAFWHTENVTVRNSIVKGEYLGWYSNRLRFENCRIIGTQPLCYCNNLELINCEMTDTDLAFEKSHVNAVITTPVVSIKNPYSGRIVVPSVGEQIFDDRSACGEIIIKTND
ncbi:MAG: DUF3737 family protein [Firmicutes bacterium]|nr:DUF3737 family protein [Bacillota bacterium]